MSGAGRLFSLVYSNVTFRKRARYDSGEDLIDPSDAFGGGFGGMGGMGGGGGVQIDPEMRKFFAPPGLYL